METDDPIASAVPPLFLAPSSLTPSASGGGGVTLEAIMQQLQWIEVGFGGHLNYLTDEMCQMNTRVGRIACRQARLGSFASSPSPSPEASTDEDDVVGDDEDDASSSGDDEMTTSQ